MPAGRTDEPGIWLLDVVIGGHVHRYASEAVEVLDVHGKAHRYLEGLAEPRLTFGSVAGVSDAAVDVQLVADVDWALLVQRGHALDRRRAVLRRWYPGRTLERARVVLRGRTAGARYGAQGETIAMSIVRSMRGQTRTWPPAQAVVDESTWPVTALYTIVEKVLGAAYPVVIGAPGHTEDPDPVCVVPVPQAERRNAVGDGRLIWLGGHATQVQVRIATDAPPFEGPEAVGSALDDLLGRRVSHCGSGENEEEGEYFLGFRDDAVYGGGLLNRRGELLRGAGDVLEWVLLEHFDGDVDVGRLQAVRALLNAWKIDTFINTPVNLWDWLSREILPLLPVEMREGPYGVYPAVVRYDLTERDAVAHLDATPGSGRVEREGAVAVVGEIANEITVEFRPVAESGATWIGRRILSARAGYLAGDDATSTADTRILGSYLCSESQRRYADEANPTGVIPMRVQAAVVWDAATAVLVAQQLAARHAWPRRALQVAGGTWLEEIEIGQAVTYTDPELHLERVVAVVADVLPEADGTKLDLLVLDHPVQRPRATS